MRRRRHLYCDEALVMASNNIIWSNQSSEVVSDPTVVANVNQFWNLKKANVRDKRNWQTSARIRSKIGIRIYWNRLIFQKSNQNGKKFRNQKKFVHKFIINQIRKQDDLFVYWFHQDASNWDWITSSISCIQCNMSSITQSKFEITRFSVFY